MYFETRQLVFITLGTFFSYIANNCHEKMEPETTAVSFYNIRQIFFAYTANNFNENMELETPFVSFYD